MEKSADKIRFGIVGLGTQGGNYTRFLTNTAQGHPGMTIAPCPPHCALGAFCDNVANTPGVKATYNFPC